MLRVLLTGGSGFIATHVLEVLLARGHSVVTTVRSEQKAQAILQSHPELQKGRLDCIIVEDIGQANGMRKPMFVKFKIGDLTFNAQHSTKLLSPSLHSTRSSTLQARIISMPRTQKSSLTQP